MAKEFTPKVSTAHKAIRIKQQHPRIAQEIASQFDLSEVAARVLAARGFRADQSLQQYIEPTLKQGLPVPELLLNLEAACEMIADHASLGQKIAICCDFDVDGLSGGSQLHHFLISNGVESQVFVPDRFADGYGLNERMVEQIAEEKYGLLICIDYGTRNAAELALARKLGLKTIVVDHHHVGNSLPGADVFINPQQDGCGFAGGILCAAGLVWYLLVGLRQKMCSANKIDVRSYLDLACLGTICDMVPLIGANRVIAKRGLELLGETRRVGLIALKNVIGLTKAISCGNISFGIGPRLNAAGRMVHGALVIELLTTNNTSRAQKIAKQLNALNIERQEVEVRVKESSIEKIKKLGELPFGIAVWDPDFHTGVVGIVAQRLVENFYRPAAVMGIDTPGIYKGSVRGIKGFNVVEALAEVGELLVKYGGHEGAGGFSVAEDKLEEFAEAWNAVCKKRLCEIEICPYAEADTEVAIADLQVELVRELERFSPFGVGNPGPLLLMNKLKISEVRSLKGQHLKATLTDGRRYISGLMWRQANHPALVAGNIVNVVCRPDINEFNGSCDVQAILQAVETCK